MLRALLMLCPVKSSFRKINHVSFSRGICLRAQKPAPNVIRARNLLITVFFPSCHIYCPPASISQCWQSIGCHDHFIAEGSWVRFLVLLSRILIGPVSSQSVLNYIEQIRSLLPRASTSLKSGRQQEQIGRANVFQSIFFKFGFEPGTFWFF